MRLLGFIIDMILMIISLFAIMLIFDKILGKENLNKTNISLFIFFLYQWLYFAIFESSKQSGTIGAILIKIKVYDETKKRITFGKASVRHLSLMLLPFGFMTIPFSKSGKCIHDYIAQTIVLEIKNNYVFRISSHKNIFESLLIQLIGKPLEKAFDLFAYYFNLVNYAVYETKLLFNPKIRLTISEFNSNLSTKFKNITNLTFAFHLTLFSIVFALNKFNILHSNTKTLKLFKNYNSDELEYAFTFISATSFIVGLFLFIIIGKLWVWIFDNGKLDSKEFDKYFINEYNVLFIFILLFNIISVSINRPMLVYFVSAIFIFHLIFFFRTISKEIEVNKFVKAISNTISIIFLWTLMTVVAFFCTFGLN